MYPIKLFASFKRERKTHYNIDGPKIYLQKTNLKKIPEAIFLATERNDHGRD